MKIIPFEVSFEYWKNHQTISIGFLHFDWCDGDTYLLGGGLYQGEWWFDCCFWWSFNTRILQPYLENKDD